MQLSKAEERRGMHAVYEKEKIPIQLDRRLRGFVSNIRANACHAPDYGDTFASSTGRQAIAFSLRRFLYDVWNHFPCASFKQYRRFCCRAFLHKEDTITAIEFALVLVALREMVR